MKEIYDKLDAVRVIAKKYHVKKIEIFGSIANETFTETSDIDLLISFHEKLQLKEYANNFFKLEMELKSLFKRDIDLITLQSLKNSNFLGSIENDKILIYENKQG